ncbi:hypothetical protein RFI_20915, partial [Reticulomyxa filosa]
LNKGTFTYMYVYVYVYVCNYGVPNEEEKDEFGLPKWFESDKIQASALIVSDYSFDHSHYSSNMSLSKWLIKHEVPALFNVDTRALTKKLRMKGSMLGKIEFGSSSSSSSSIEWFDPNKVNLVALVSRKQIWEYGSPKESTSTAASSEEVLILKNILKDSGNNKSSSSSTTSSSNCDSEDEHDSLYSEFKRNRKAKIIAVDCGIKNNIIRYLCRKNVHLKVVPWDYDFNQEQDLDGLFISNGPGDPTMVKKTIEHVRTFIKTRSQTPLLGICLGNQILALAAGAKTYKVLFFFFLKKKKE